MGADFVPWLSPHLSYFAIYYRLAPQGMGSDWKNLPSTTQFLSTQTYRHYEVPRVYRNQEGHTQRRKAAPGRPAVSHTERKPHKAAQALKKN
jgi:hypothetical protein